MTSLINTDAARFRVLLVAPHRLVRLGIRAGLERSARIEVVAEASTTDEVPAALLTSTPSVIIVDPRVPGKDPLQLVRILRGLFRNRTAPILVLADEDAMDTRALLEMGVRGVLQHGCDEHELASAVTEIALGGAVFSSEVTCRLLDWYLDSVGQTPRRPPAVINTLTPRELDVLLLLATGMSNSQIAEKLTLGLTTVKSHVYHLMKKLDLPDRANAVAFAYQYGLVARHAALEGCNPPGNGPRYRLSN
ncbi:response regulator transcription factor [Saccharothrix sp. NRRL B-16314]|uniref:response regulator transcription factor n=1 Tax=Saccharothrix sp. NRRL B-16314 TaxID=1463825 RepID=UPI0012DFB1A2|nr:response regulator transcription factor [Saccharothrix sp. NRRL B-16314]